jgi:hypothetical protein
MTTPHLTILTWTREEKGRLVGGICGLKPRQDVEERGPLIIEAEIRPRGPSRSPTRSIVVLNVFVRLFGEFREQEA